jgi:uncharacterized membrane protein HdeD (DUF308 family)
MHATESRRPSTNPPERLPWWMQALLAAAMCALGLALALDAGAALTSPGILLGAGLATAGLLRAAGSERAPLRHFELGVGIVVAAFGLVALNWREASPRALAQIVAAALITGGLASTIEALMAPPGERLAAGLAGIATLLFPALMLAWPEPSLLSLGAIAGAWLTFAGLAQLGSAFLRRPRTRGAVGTAPLAARRPPPLRLLGTLISLALALLVLGASLFLQRAS